MPSIPFVLGASKIATCPELFLDRIVKVVTFCSLLLLVRQWPDTYATIHWTSRRSNKIMYLTVYGENIKWLFDIGRHWGYFVFSWSEPKVPGFFSFFSCWKLWWSERECEKPRLHHCCIAVALLHIALLTKVKSTLNTKNYQNLIFFSTFSNAFFILS